MKKLQLRLLLLIILFIPLVSCEQINIDIPSNYSKISNDEKGVIYSVQKISDEIIVSKFIIKENNDWSFRYLMNEEYINSQLKSNEIENTGNNLVSEFKMLMKKEFYFKSVGNTLLYSFEFKENNNSLVNTVFQFIKNEKLYTCTGLTLKSVYRESFNDYLKIIESIKFGEAEEKIEKKLKTSSNQKTLNKKSDFNQMSFEQRKTLARKYFVSGRDKFDFGDIDGAMEDFEYVAYSIPTPNDNSTRAIYYLALCHRKLGDINKFCQIMRSIMDKDTAAANWVKNNCN